MNRETLIAIPYHAVSGDKQLRNILKSFVSSGLKYFFIANYFLFQSLWRWVFFIFHLLPRRLLLSTFWKSEQLASSRFLHSEYFIQNIMFFKVSIILSSLISFFIYSFLLFYLLFYSFSFYIHLQIMPWHLFSVLCIDTTQNTLNYLISSSKCVQFEFIQNKVTNLEQVFSYKLVT